MSADDVICGNHGNTVVAVIFFGRHLGYPHHALAPLCVRIGWCAGGIKLAWNISTMFEHSKCKVAIGTVTAGCIVRGYFLPCARMFTIF
jgi:hypothetical protein